MKNPELIFESVAQPRFQKSIPGFNWFVILERHYRNRISVTGCPSCIEGLSEKSDFLEFCTSALGELEQVQVGDCAQTAGGNQFSVLG